MPTRKQRRRREKTFRHEAEWVEIDEEGNESAVDADSVRAEREERRTQVKTEPAKNASKSGKKSGRPVRVPPPPSWERAVKRGGLMGLLSFLLFVFVLKGGALELRIGYGVAYMIAFVPLTYWVDRWTYRTYLRRAASQSQGTKSGKR